MTEADSIKWALLDLLKICDAAHEGRLHGDLARIARTLGVELTEPATLAVRPELPFSQAKMELATTDNWKAEQERKMKAFRN